MPTESRNSDGQLTPSRASVDELKLELLSSLVYMHLVAALSPNSPSVFTTEVLNEAIIWCSSATPEQVRHKSAILLPMLRSGIDKTLVALPPKVPWRSLAEDAWERWKSGDISWSHGIRFGWLDQSFDCRALGLPEDLPYHAVIGIGHHADLGAVEEHMLLSDSFFLLLKAGTAYRFMKQMASRLKESSSLAPLEANALLSPQNLNVGAYARTAAIGFYAFVECFVNSVGQDYILRHPTIDKDRKEYLKGKKGKRYLSTEHKLEKYPAYIRADRKSPIVISDPLQRIEPYKSFVERIKDVRDAANHYGSGKADIWRSPGDWLRLANDACAICVDVAKGFWTACYPDRDQPSYLFRLDRKKFMHLAQSRADLENQARSETQDAAVPPEDS